MMLHLAHDCIAPTEIWQNRQHAHDDGGDRETLKSGKNGNISAGCCREGRDEREKAAETAIPIGYPSAGFVKIGRNGRNGCPLSRPDAWL
jgi:hypothetical protein